MSNIISLEKINVAFAQGQGNVVRAVQDVTLQVEKGDIYGIVGFSGAGKSTLVRTINLLQVPTSGNLRVDGTDLVRAGRQIIGNRELRAKRRRIGMIFQNFNLLDETTVIQNVAFALKHAQLSEKEKAAKALKLLELVDLKDKANFYPAQLSGGQQQRVAIARALANSPKILISDEATSALDPQNTNQILDLLKKLNQELGLTIVLITHEMAAIKRICDKVAVMEHGRIIENASLRDVFLHPKQDLTRRFVGGSLAAIQTLEKLNLGPLKADEVIYQLVYGMTNVTQSIIIDLYRRLGVEISMLYGNVELLNQEPIGTLVVLLKGDYVQQQEALKFLHSQGVTVSKLDERGN